MDEATLSLIKSSLIVGVIGFILYKVVSAYRRFQAYAKVFNDCPGETDTHWLYGTIHHVSIDYFFIDDFVLGK
jgi:hypothetical protein